MDVSELNEIVYWSQPYILHFAIKNDTLLNKEVNVTTQLSSKFETPQDKARDHDFRKASY